MPVYIQIKKICTSCKKEFYCHIPPVHLCDSCEEIRSRYIKTLI